MEMSLRLLAARAFSWAFLLTLFGLPACRQTAALVGTVDSGAAIDAGVSGSVAREARAELTLIGDAGRQTFDLLKADGGLLESLSEDVPQGLELRVEPVPTVPVRVRLFDWTNRLVSSDDVMETDAQKLQYTIRLLEPLRRGRTYQLEIDAESEAPFRADSGINEFESLWRFRVAGEIEAEPAAAKKSSAAQSKPKANKERRRR